MLVKVKLLKKFTSKRIYTIFNLTSEIIIKEINKFNLLPRLNDEDDNKNAK